MFIYLFLRTNYLQVTFLIGDILSQSRKSTGLPKIIRHKCTEAGSWDYVNGKQP